MYYSIEFVRLLAVVLITFTHVRHNFTEGVMYVLLEQIPLYGTLILSVISGFLFAEITNKKKDSLLRKKIRSLLIPFLIANILVIIPVVIAHHFGFNFLNRLDISLNLITDGLFSVSNAPVNPPTYFIRDLFIIFLLVEILRSRNVMLVLGIIAFAFFGELLLRYDILVLFLAGVAFSRYKFVYQDYKWWSLAISLILALLLFVLDVAYAKHALTLFFFILLLNWNIGFMNVGGYSYTLHLYHSPIIVVLFPILYTLIENQYLLVFAQLASVFVFISLMYFLIRKMKLNFMIGGR